MILLDCFFNARSLLRRFNIGSEQSREAQFWR